MDSFELIVGKLLEGEGNWIRHSVKINLSKDEKKKIGKPTAPRPEIDIIALNVKDNRLLILEIKSYLDSNGVRMKEVINENDEQQGRYKLLTSEKYRKTLTGRLLEDWRNIGIINNETKFTFGLIAGKVYQNKEKELTEYFDEKGWMFWGPSTIKAKIERLADSDYEDNPITLAAKILGRK